MGTDELRPRAVGTADLAHEGAAAFRPRFDEKGVTSRVQHTAGPAQAHADPQRTAQVIANLLENALRHTPSGGEVTIRTSASREGVRFEVTDTGSGIPPEELPHVFSRFHRVDKARSYDPNGGSGIGLTIAKHYMERQGGRIGVESEPGRGSRFWFSLPRASDNN